MGLELSSPVARGATLPRRGVFSAQKCTFLDFGFKMAQKKVEIQGAGPQRLDSQRNSAQNPGIDAQNGGMATHLVKNWCDMGAGWGSGPGQHTLAVGGEPLLCP